MRVPPGQHEVRERRQLALPARRWPPRGAPSRRPRRGGRAARAFASCGVASSAPTAEQLLLDAGEVRVDLGILDERPGGADRGVQLVDLAVGLHARVALPDPRTPEEAGLAAVARLRVDLHAPDTIGRVGRAQPSPDGADLRRRGARARRAGRGRAGLGGRHDRAPAGRRRRAHPARRGARGAVARRARRARPRGGARPVRRGEARARAARDAATRATGPRSRGRSRGSRPRRWRGSSPRRRSPRWWRASTSSCPEGGGPPRALELNATIPAMPGLRRPRGATPGSAPRPRARGQDPARRRARSSPPAGATWSGCARRSSPFYRARGGDARAAVHRARGPARRRADRRAAPARRALPADGARGRGTSSRTSASPRRWDVLYRHVWAHRVDPGSRRSPARCASPAATSLANPVNGLLEAKALFARLSECAEDAALADLAGLDAEERAAAARLPWTRRLDAAVAARVLAGPRALRGEAELGLRRQERPPRRGAAPGRLGGAPSRRRSATSAAAASWRRSGSSRRAGPRRASRRRATTRGELYRDLSTYCGLGPSRPDGSVVRAAASPVVNILGGGGLAPWCRRTSTRRCGDRGGALRRPRPAPRDGHGAAAAASAASPPSAQRKSATDGTEASTSSARGLWSVSRCTASAPARPARTRSRGPARCRRRAPPGPSGPPRAGRAPSTRRPRGRRRGFMKRCTRPPSGSGNPWRREHLERAVLHPHRPAGHVGDRARPPARRRARTPGRRGAGRRGVQ